MDVAAGLLAASGLLFAVATDVPWPIQEGSG